MAYTVHTGAYDRVGAAYEAAPEVFRALGAGVSRRLPRPQRLLRDELRSPCRASGVPMFSPHDLRHRRITPRAMLGVWTAMKEVRTTPEKVDVPLLFLVAIATPGGPTVTARMSMPRTPSTAPA